MNIVAFLLAALKVPVGGTTQTRLEEISTVKQGSGHSQDRALNFRAGLAFISWSIILELCLADC